MCYFLKFKQAATTALHWLFDYFIARPVEGLVAVVQGLELAVPPVVRAVARVVVEQFTPGERGRLQAGAGLLMQGLALLVGPVVALLVLGYGGVLAVGLVVALVLMLLPSRGSPLAVRG
jgi:MFS family permease